MKSKRKGFTLVELLVVIAIIGILVALLLPAVQAARESARRAQCVNHLKQFGIAMQNYHDACKVLPPGGFTKQYPGAPKTSAGVSAHEGYSVHARLLPYMEQAPLYGLINFNFDWTAPKNLPVASVRVKTFLCPSDAGLQAPAAYGAPNNYYCNYGTNIIYGDPLKQPPGSPNASMPQPNGVFYFDFCVPFSAILDGTSNTAAFSEKVTGDFNNGISTLKSDTFRPGTFPATLAQAVIECNAIDVTNLGFQGYSAVGAPWIASYHSITTYQHTNVPNGRSCMYPPLRIMTTANSYHPTGVNLCMCDGSVRFVSAQVDIFVWNSIGTRDGNESMVTSSSANW